MANIKDVAKHAKVGVGTVSRYINNSGYVSDITKRKIKNSIEKLKYKPNELARNFSKNTSCLIGLIVPNIEHPFFSSFAKYVECELYELGYKTLMCNTIGISDREKEYLDMLDRNLVDGIITCTQSMNNEHYLSIDKPIVSFDHDFGEKIPTVHSNHTKGGELAAYELINAGCKNVVQFSTPLSVPTPSNERHFAFENVMKKNKINIETFQTEWNIFEYDYFYSMFKIYLNKLNGIDAIFTPDLCAVCCLKIAQEKNLKVPKDLKIVGYDGLNLSNYINPKLTTVSQNIPLLAQTCVRTLLDKINGKKDIPSLQILDVYLKSGFTT